MSHWVNQKEPSSRALEAEPVLKFSASLGNCDVSS